MAALGGHQTVSQIASENEVHPTDTVTFWVLRKVFSSLKYAKIRMFNRLKSPI
jgi:hypothetical protein